MIDTAQKKTFENSMEELEKIINLLEDGDAALDECIKLFEKGVKLSDECLKMLDGAQQKITLLKKGGEIDFTVNGDADND